MNEIYAIGAHDYSKAAQMGNLTSSKNAAKWR
jgi:hypothetical protein